MKLLVFLKRTLKAVILGALVTVLLPVIVPVIVVMVAYDLKLPETKAEKAKKALARVHASNLTRMAHTLRTRHQEIPDHYVLLLEDIAKELEKRSYGDL